MKLTESHLRQMIRQELKKAMGLNEGYAQEKGGIALIDLTKLVQLLTASGDTHHADMITSNRPGGKNPPYVFNGDLNNPNITLYYGSTDSPQAFTQFPTKLVKQALMRSNN